MHIGLIDDVSERLHSRDRCVVLDDSLVSSAVIVLLLYKAGDLSVLFTKRSDKVEHHKGEISFPGGVLDRGDNSLKFCVLRELFEELGVRGVDVRVLGLLDDIKTVASPFIITPFVGFMPYPYNFVINSNEVDDVIVISVNSFLDSCGYEEVFMQGRWVSYFYCGSHVIWGATGMILKQFLDLAFDFSGD